MNRPSSHRLRSVWLALQCRQSQGASFAPGNPRPAGCIVCTKISPSHMEPKSVVVHCEASLRRLQTDYLDRQVLSVVVTAPDFKAAVPLTEETYGYVTSAFMLAYAVMNGLSGPFIDAVGTRRLLGVALTIG